MSEKGLRALVGTVAVLFLIWMGVTFLPRGGGGAGAPPDELAGFFQGMTAEGVISVRVRGPSSPEPLELTRSGEGWRVNAYRADSAVVARLWGAMGEARIGNLVGSNPANHPRLGVARDSALVLEVAVAGETRTLLVGKSGSGYGTAYVRLPEADEVFLMDGNLRSTLTRSLDDWRNKRVATVDTARVQRIEVEREGRRFTLERADSLWVLDGRGEAETTPVRNLLGELARLDASGFYTDADTLTGSGGSVRALGVGGDTLAFLELGSGEGDRWIRAEGDPITYRLASWRVGRLLPDPEGLRGGG